MRETKERPRTTPASGIRHPLPGKHTKYFAAFGFVEGVDEVFGQLKHQDGTAYSGVQIHPPSTDTGFWVIHFVRDDFPDGDGNTYTLEVYDASDTEGTPIQTVSGLTFSPREKSSLRKGDHGYGTVSVTYPQSDTPVDSEFAAYGTAPNSVDVSGTCSNCTYQIMQGSGGPNWVLYCMVSAPSPPVDCTLTVQQANANPGQGTFEIPKN